MELFRNIAELCGSFAMLFLAIAMVKHLQWHKKQGDF